MSRLGARLNLRLLERGLTDSLSLFGACRRAALAAQINDESDEVAAEIAELTAAGEESTA